MHIQDINHNCHLCNGTMGEFTQCGRQYGHCTNPRCNLYMATLEMGTHEALSAAQIEQYAVVNAWRRLERVGQLVTLFGEAGNHDAR